MTISGEVRRQFIILVRRKESRKVGGKYPYDWRPESVTNPESGMSFTRSSAWELIAIRLENGEPMETIELKNPQGATGYVMKINLEPDRPKLYVKLQLRSGKIIGRSFHYSDPR